MEHSKRASIAVEAHDGQALAQLLASVSLPEFFCFCFIVPRMRLWLGACFLASVACE